MKKLCLLFIWTNLIVFYFKQKTAYEMRISDWSSDVCSSDLSPGSGASESAPNGFGHIFNRILLSKKHQADHCPSLGLDKFCPDARPRDAAEQRTGNRLHAESKALVPLPHAAGATADRCRANERRETVIHQYRRRARTTNVATRQDERRGAETRRKRAAK